MTVRGYITSCSKCRQESIDSCGVCGEPLCQAHMDAGCCGWRPAMSLDGIENGRDEEE